MNADKKPDQKNKTQAKKAAPKTRTRTAKTDTKKTVDEQNGKKSNAFPIVGIGASAGGLKAFEKFFSNIPKKTDLDLAFVLVQHLDPDHKSLLTELVRRFTDLQVSEITDGLTVLPNNVYIIPENKDLAIMKGKLQLLDPVSPRGLRVPIDNFFRSLALDQKEQSIGIVLSGTGTDGTLGLKEIKGQGGMTMVQEPATAEYDGMPRSAIRGTTVDYILPPQEMAGRLLDYIEYAFNKYPSREPINESKQVEDGLNKIFMLLRGQVGYDFSSYKKNTINRRIERRMTVNQIDDLDTYIRYLRENPMELDLLFRNLLIGVTSFFRDAEAFDILKKEVIEPLVEKLKPAQPLRIWVPGCASGEEAYSIAMLVQEALDKKNKHPKVQIFATDIDPEAIEKARAGIYPESIAADVSPARLARYFQSEDSSYRVNKSLRDMIVFALQNMIEDPPFSKIDLISCRNVLIYMESNIQKKVLSLFRYSLNENGCLFLGTSESIGDFVDDFDTVDRKWKIYKLKPGALYKPITDIGMSFHSDAAREKPAAEKEREFNLREYVENALLSDYTPSAVIINEQGDGLYFHGHTGRYLEPSQGDATLNIIKMAREGLRMGLTNAIRKVSVEKKPCKSSNIKVKTNGDSVLIDLEVTPIIQPDSKKDLLMVTFQEIPHVKLDASGKKIADAADNKDQRIAELEHELGVKEEYLQTTIEELETSNEELKSTNEELQSSNEELQSTNEELGTSREELQSVNEELVTVNTELQNKIEQLSLANNDLSNLMAATGIGTVFVDNKLDIQRFTPAATDVINLIQGDIGRPVSHIVSNLNYDGLVEDVQTVLDKLIPREKEVRTKKGKWYLMRILPYRTLENTIEGAVINFIDISIQKKAQEQLADLKTSAEEAQRYAENIVETVPDPLITLDSDMKVASANHAFYELFQVKPSETEGHLLFSLGNGQWNIPELTKLLKEVLPEHKIVEDYRVEHKFQIIGRRVMLINAREVLRENGKSKFILLAIRDITE